MRFETPSGHRAQVDFGRFVVDFADDPGTSRVVWLFSLVLGHSRFLFARYGLHQDLQTPLRCHIQAFEAIGGVPIEILYDRMSFAPIEAWIYSRQANTIIPFAYAPLSGFTAARGELKFKRGFLSTAASSLIALGPMGPAHADSVQKDHSPIAAGSPGLAPPTYVTVEEGRSLNGIAYANHVSPAALAAANHLSPPYKLKIGSRLLLPSPSQIETTGDAHPNGAAEPEKKATAAAQISHASEGRTENVTQSPALPASSATAGQTDGASAASSGSETNRGSATSTVENGVIVVRGTPSR